MDGEEASGDEEYLNMAIRASSCPSDRFRCSPHAYRSTLGRPYSRNSSTIHSGIHKFMLTAAHHVTGFLNCIKLHVIFATAYNISASQGASTVSTDLPKREIDCICHSYTTTWHLSGKVRPLEYTASVHRPIIHTHARLTEVGKSVIAIMAGCATGIIISRPYNPRVYDRVQIDKSIQLQAKLLGEHKHDEYLAEFNKHLAAMRKLTAEEEAAQAAGGGGAI